MKKSAALVAVSCLLAGGWAYAQFQVGPGPMIVKTPGGTILGLSVSKASAKAGEKLTLTVQGQGRCAVRVRSAQSSMPLVDIKDAPFPLTAEVTFAQVGAYDLKAAPYPGKDPLVNPEGRLCSSEAGAHLSVMAANAPVMPGPGGNAPALAGAGGPGLSHAVPSALHASLPSKLELQDTIGAYQAHTKLKATLKAADGQPAPGKTVEFRVAGAPAGSAQTGVDGVAVLDFVVPESVPTGANAVEARSAGLSATGHLGVFKAATRLNLSVLYTGNEAVEQGRSVVLRGHLRLAGEPDTGLKGRKVSITVSAQEAGSANTDDTGLFELKHPIPYGAAKSHEAVAHFDGDGHYLATASKATQIHVKPASNRLPPPVTTGPAIQAAGATKLPPAVTVGTGIHGVGALKLPAAFTAGPAIHATGAAKLPPAVTAGPAIHAIGNLKLPPAVTGGAAIHAIGLY